MFFPANRTAFIKGQKISGNQPTSLLYLQRYIKQYPTIEGATPRYALPEALKSNAQNDSDYKYLRRVLDEKTGRYTFHKDKIRGLFKKYLVEPCKHVVDFLGPDLFTPARFDITFYSEVDHELDDYYLDWSCFSICQALIKDEKALYHDVINYVLTYQNQIE